MEAMFANSRASNIGQELLEAKMMVNSAMKQEAFNCARCIEAKEDRKKRALAGEKLPAEKCQHCHCGFYSVDAEFLAELRNCEPFKKDKEKEDKSVKETESKKKERDEAEKKSKEEEAGKVRKEVNLMKKRYYNLEQKKNTEKEKSDKGKEENKDPSGSES